MTQAITRAPAPLEADPLIVQDQSQFANLLDTSRFEHMFRVAGVFANSTIIPEHYRKNEGNCFIALQMAVRLGVDPFMFMQRTYIVHGKPGMEAQLAIALMNTSGLFENSIDYEIHCDDPDGNPFDASYRVRAWAIRKATKHRVNGPWVDWPLVRAEKWDAKEGSKWKTMPGPMFIYRAATFFGRMHCPERLMGMATADELQDINGVVDVTPVNDEPAQRLQLRGSQGAAARANPAAPSQTSPAGDVRGATNPAGTVASGQPSPAPLNPAATSSGATTGGEGSKSSPPAGKTGAAPCPVCKFPMANGRCVNCPPAAKTDAKGTNAPAEPNGSPASVAAAQLQQEAAEAVDALDAKAAQDAAEAGDVESAEDAGDPFRHWRVMSPKDTRDTIDSMGQENFSKVWAKMPADVKAIVTSNSNKAKKLPK